MGVGETERSLGDGFTFESALFANVGFLVDAFCRACDVVSSPLALALFARRLCNGVRFGLFTADLLAPLLPPFLLFIESRSSATTTSFLSLLRSFFASSFLILRRSRSFNRSSCIFSNSSNLAFRSSALSSVVASGVVVVVVLTVVVELRWLRLCNADGSFLAPLRRNGFFAGRLLDGSSFDASLPLLLLLLLPAAPIFICRSPNSRILSNDFSLLLRMCLFI
mmetsp:Transcript_27938/g.56046  ORF Transcript_27938/g.56046 Transcript_27938/m.56046 type:complete len:223 (-) Transcript_27938:27-695(-)